MRRMLVLAAALGMMWAVERLRMDGVQASPDPLTLAAIGFVVLAAFTVGEIGGALKLPKVTGYIVSGVLLGPQVSDVLSERVVGEMATFNTLALGLIATTAGLELDLSAIRKVLRTLAVMERDAKKMRGERPFLFTNLKQGDGVAAVVDFIVTAGLLPAPRLPQ